MSHTSGPRPAKRTANRKADPLAHLLQANPVARGPCGIIGSHGDRQGGRRWRR
ncbi:hypothetical protein BJX96DRAFT_149003 [Aspergillus floccosus]